MMKAMDFRGWILGGLGMVLLAGGAQVQGNPDPSVAWGPVVKGLQCGLVSDWDGQAEPRFTVLLKNHTKRVLSVPAPATMVRQEDQKGIRRWSQPLHPEVRSTGEGEFWIETRAGESSETLSKTILQIPPGETAEIVRQPLQVSSWMPDRPDYPGRLSVHRIVLVSGGLYQIRLVFRSQQPTLFRTSLWHGQAPSGWVTLKMP